LKSFSVAIRILKKFKKGDYDRDGEDKIEENEGFGGDRGSHKRVSA